MNFELHIHPGRACGNWPDGSYCYTTEAGAHFTAAPPPDADTPPEPVDWPQGWTDLGYLREDGQTTPAALGGPAD